MNIAVVVRPTRHKVILYGLPVDLDAIIKEWYRQQMWLAQDERVTILGHPWYIGKALWYDDFSVIPHSMNMDIAHALKENNKYVECNAGVLCDSRTSEKFRMQYSEFMRELFEMGIPVTYGSDYHNKYGEVHLEAERCLAAARAGSPQRYGRDGGASRG